MFPPIEPFASAHLEVGNGQAIYWEASGNPRGKPALSIHGGPGGGMGSGYRRRFDPSRWLIVGFEQRGCGRSRPLVTDALDSLPSNTTQALISDIEALRAHLAVERWMLVGTSWGTTLALAYAQAHPDRVSGLASMCVTTTSAAEVAWITEDLRRVFPREWERFEAGSERRAGERVIDGYHRRLASPDPRERDDAARAWCAWEDTHVSLDPRHQPSPSYDDPSYRQVFATLVVHYWKHAAFLPEGALRAGMSRIAHIPGALIHGRLDISSPLEVAWDLHRAWPQSSLVVVDDEGHGGHAMVDELVRAIARFAP